MAVYRVNKNRSYTVMANYHLRDKTLSLKAVGLLSKMLSFNDGWQFSTKGLSAICKEGPDAVLAALRELEDAGYLVRHQSRDEKGRMSSMVFEIYEKPQTGLPDTEKPHTEKPDTDNPFTGKPCTENPAQLNTNQVITNERNNSLRNYQSINLDGMDRMDEREQYRELIRDNLEIDIRSQDRHYDLDRVNEIVEIMLDAVCSTRPTIRINGEDMPQPVVKSRFLKLDSGHIDYVLQAMNDCPSDIRNIRAYLLTALYNASLTIVMAVFDIGQNVVAGAAGVISGDTNIDIESTLEQMRASMETMGIGELLGLSIETLLISLCLKIMSILITVILYGRMIEIYCTVSIAPIPIATMSNREWGSIGTNYLKGLFALAFQGFLIMVCVAIYAVLINNMIIAANIHSALFSVAAYTVILCFSLFKTGSLAKSLFNAH